MHREAQAHLPVLVDEVEFFLRPRRGGWVVDGTIGIGGHAERLMERAPRDTRLLGLDRDPEALARAERRLAPFGDRIVLRHASFRDLGPVTHQASIVEAQAVFLDLGLSSYQLDESGRGFSFLRDEPLDMRFDPTSGSTAADLLNALPEPELARLLSEGADEPHARRIARRIVEERRRAPFRATADLVRAVKAAVPRRAWPRRIHVATRTFQALRMAVNDERSALEAVLPAAARLLAGGGRLGVIAFHSGEDRVVKRAFRTLAEHGFAELQPSPVVPSAEEAANNPRARSAKLRVLERLEAA